MKKLLILSGKGGTGKTTVAAAFIGFAQAEAIADCDVDAPNLHLVIQLDTEPEQWAFFGSQKARILPDKCADCGLCAQACRFDAIQRTATGVAVREYRCEGCGVCAYVCSQKAIVMEEDLAGTQTRYRGKRVFSTASLRMGRGNSGKLVTAVKDALMEAVADQELSIIDGSPGIGCPVIASVSGVDLVLLVTEPSLSGISDMKRILKTAAILGARTAVCVNKVDMNRENAETIERFCDAHNIPFMGMIPYDPQASAAINAGISLSQVSCPASEALRRVYTRTMKQLEGGAA